MIKKSHNSGKNVVLIDKRSSMLAQVKPDFLKQKFQGENFEKIDLWVGMDAKYLI